MQKYQPKKFGHQMRMKVKMGIQPEIKLPMTLHPSWKKISEKLSAIENAIEFTIRKISQ